MATYKTSDLIDRLREIASDGCDYIEISCIDAEDDLPEALSFEGLVDETSGVGYEEVESCSPVFNSPDPSDYEDFDDPCEPSGLNFTFGELKHIDLALDNALEFGRQILKQKDVPRDLRDQVKSDSVAWRNLHAKLAQYFKITFSD